MTPVLVGMAVCVLAALVVLALVALPRVRSGERLLTPDGGDTVREASRRARERATRAAGHAGVLASGVRSRALAQPANARRRANEARSRRAEREQTVVAGGREQPVVVGGQEQTVVAGGRETPQPPDAWTPGTDIRPAGSVPREKEKEKEKVDDRAREPARRARTVTVDDAPPSLTGMPGDAALAERVIDLRDPLDTVAPAPGSGTAHDAVPPPASRHALRTARGADLGWGEPRPGPRHAR